MPSPRALTQTPAASLDWSRPGTPAAPNFNDVYFSTDGGLQESRAVFLEGCGLPQRWKNKAVFTLAELGFGSGLNFLATWQMWKETAQPEQRLHFVSIEKFPFDKSQLSRALAAWPELSIMRQQLINAWPGRVKGIHRLEFDHVTLTLIHEDVSQAFGQIDNLKADAWFLDGFSPSGNPDMWHPDLMKRVAERCASEARLATFSVAGSVRNALTEAGFDVRKMPGFGRKRHRLEATFFSPVEQSTATIDRALIVGAGIAGRSLARALQLRKIDFDIIDNRAHPAASANPAALVKPRFDLQDRPESRFFLSAYLHALRSYPEAAVIDRGVRQLPKTDKESERFLKLTEQAPLGDGHLNWQDGVLQIESALVIDPKLLFNECEIHQEAFDPKSIDGKYSHVILAAGYGIRELAPSLHLRLSRGQLSWAKPVWDIPTAYGGYALNIDGASLVGATHDRLDERDPFELRDEDDERNLSALADISGMKIMPTDRKSRASVRVTSRDTLPIMADLGAQSGAETWALTGLGSRGFTFAPLLAEALIAHLCDEVGPLEKEVRAMFSAPTRLD